MLSWIPERRAGHLGPASLFWGGGLKIHILSSRLLFLNFHKIWKNQGLTKGSHSISLAFAALECEPLHFWVLLIFVGRTIKYYKTKCAEIQEPLLFLRITNIKPIGPPKYQTPILWFAHSLFPCFMAPHQMTLFAQKFSPHAPDSTIRTRRSAFSFFSPSVSLPWRLVQTPFSPPALLLPQTPMSVTRPMIAPMPPFLSPISVFSFTSISRYWYNACSETNSGGRISAVLSKDIQI